MKRRDALRQLGIGTAGALLWPRSLAAERTELRPDRLAALAERIRRTPHAEIFDLAADAIVHGADPQTLLGATFVAGVHDVRPRPVGGNLHSVMLVESSYRLVESAASPREAWLVALWTLDGFKATQEEEDGKSWVLPPAPEVSFANEAAARRELIAALDGWDDARADRAIVGLLPYHDRESLYEILWPYTARSMAYLGHKIVYGAMTEAVLRRIDWKYAEPTARSLVYGLVGRGGGDPLTRPFASAMALASSLPDGWLEAKRKSPAHSEALMSRLLALDHAEAQHAVVDSFREGYDASTVWDAIRLAVAELFLRRKSDDPRSGEAIRAVHAVTELWSMGNAWRRAKTERTRRVLMLQAAGWVADLRDMLLDRKAIAMEGPGLAALGQGRDEKIATLDELFEADRPSAARVFLDAHPEQAAPFLQRLRHEVASKGVEYHQFKYAVALEDESRLADPRWTALLFAPALSYMPTPRDRVTEKTTRALRALEKAQVI